MLPSFLALRAQTSLELQEVVAARSSCPGQRGTPAIAFFSYGVFLSYFKLALNTEENHCQEYSLPGMQNTSAE